MAQLLAAQVANNAGRARVGSNAAAVLIDAIFVEVGTLAPKGMAATRNVSSLRFWVCADSFLTSAQPSKGRYQCKARSGCGAFHLLLAECAAPS